MLEIGSHEIGSSLEFNYILLETISALAEITDSSKTKTNKINLKYNGKLKI